MKLLDEIIEAADKATKRPWDFDSEEQNPEGDKCNWDLYPPAEEDHSIAIVNGMVNGTSDAHYITVAANNADRMARALKVAIDALEDEDYNGAGITWPAIVKIEAILEGNL